MNPLAFAVRDDFAHAERLADLPGTVTRALQRVNALAIPGDVRDRLERLAADIATATEDSARRAAIEAALAELTRMQESAFAEELLARAPQALPGVGPKRSATLGRRAFTSVADLLFHLPRRYDDRRERSDIGDLRVGLRATFVGRVLVSDFTAARGRRRGRGGRSFEAVVGDETGHVRLKWFHGTEAIANMARKGMLLLVSGEVTRYRFDLEVVHPEIELLAGEEGEGNADSTDAAVTGGITPDYTSPEGIHPRAMRRLAAHALSQYADLVIGHLPETFARSHRLPEPADALRALHAPPPDCDLELLETGRSPASRRLILEELYLLELGLAQRRARRRRETGIPVAPDAGAVARTIESLPFRLTAAQQRAWAEIEADLTSAHPMSRLLEGDVGCGKTVVAFLAAVAAAKSGHQTALMAPTELLAEQHARTLRHLVQATGNQSGVHLALLTSSVPRAQADAVRADLASGAVDLVVGTHALVQESVAFRRLALVVIDEQHRFGVRQRAALAAKTPGSESPHTLVMTATPIPRTLALTLHGDLDLTVIDELPPGRSPTRTRLFRTGEGDRIGELLRATVARGEQVYVVYPLIEESEKNDLRSASDSAERIRRAFPEIVVELIHGRMDAETRGAVMDRFAAGQIQVLVSTTVIEVGVDVPNATLMIIEHAERFGLAQLHQLRGRVGRGTREGTCLCVARAVTEESEARLRALLSTTDGFAIAEADLAIRGPGEFLGTRQSGRLPDLRFADLARDAGEIALARDLAEATLRQDPGLEREPELARAVRSRWGDRLALAGVG